MLFRSEGVGHTSGPISYFAPSSGALITAASQGVGPNATDGGYASSSNREWGGDAAPASPVPVGGCVEGRTIVHQTYRDPIWCDDLAMGISKGVLAMLLSPALGQLGEGGTDLKLTRLTNGRGAGQDSADEGGDKAALIWGRPSAHAPLWLRVRLIALQSLPAAPPALGGATSTGRCSGKRAHALAGGRDETAIEIGRAHV